MIELGFRKPLRIALGGQMLTFATRHDLDFSLQGRTEIPAGRVAAFNALTTTELRGEALRIRAVEKQLLELIARSLDEPARVGTTLAAMDLHLFSNDHRWRDIMAALRRLPARFDEHKRLALTKYLQYLGSRQELLKMVYVEKRRLETAEHALRGSGAPWSGRPRETPAGVPPPERPGKPPPGTLAETAVFATPPEGLRAPAGSIRLPRGETVSLDCPPGATVRVMLSRHPFELLRDGGGLRLRDPRGHLFTLAAGKRTLGRGKRCDVVVDPRYRDISRRHLIVDVEEGQRVALTDISSHGTFVVRSEAGTRAAGAT